MRPWLETRLILPFVPFLLDLLARVLLLRSKLGWWEIPDLKTLSITSAFFCFLIALDVEEVERIPSDAEYYSPASVMRRRFSVYGIGTAVIFGLAAAVDAAERSLSISSLSSSLYPALIVTTTTILVIAIIEAIIANYRYQFKYG
ncbi:MAG TPA: hypothetical protein VFP12_16820 [Allosphingosinicella sp.]|nr:hypothetical protein [Allosphingosinicella sp.]